MSPSYRPLYLALARTLLLAVGLVLLLWFVFEAQAVIMATVLALILAIALNVPVTALEGRGMKRGWAVALSFLAVAVVLGGVGWLVVPRLLQEIPSLIETIPQLAAQAAAQIGAVVGDTMAVERQLDRALDWGVNLFRGVWRYTGDALEALVLLLFLVALILFMVANLRPMLRWYVRSMPEHHREPATRAFAHASGMVVGWVVASAVLGGIKAVAAFVFLTVMGVPGAIVWSTLAFFGAFVPQIGFYLMSIPPVVVAFSVSPLTALWTLFFFLALSELLGKFIAPRIFAETMELSAVYVLVMTVAMGYVFGAIGVLIAAPVAGFLKAYYDAFYLERQPEDPVLEQRVEAMVHRDPGGAASSDGRAVAPAVESS